MLDSERIDSIFSNMEMYVGQLRRLAGLSREELEDDFVKLGAAKYHLWEIDTGVLHSTLQNNLQDFDRFKASIYRLLHQSAADN